MKRTKTQRMIQMKAQKMIIRTHSISKRKKNVRRSQDLFLSGHCNKMLKKKKNASKLS